MINGNCHVSQSATINLEPSYWQATESADKQEAESQWPVTEPLLFFKNKDMIILAFKISWILLDLIYAI